MKTRMTDYYMSLAWRTAELSRAVKLKVGCVLVTPDDAMLMGFNGTPAGWDNNCEYELADGSLKTYDYVLHAEANAISKLAKSTLSGKGASLYLTHSPCIHCAKIIYQAGITNVYYAEEYRSRDGVVFLQQCGVNILQVD